MVDRDKIREKASGESTGDKQKKSSKSNSSGSGSGSAVDIDEKSQEEKLEEFKKAEGISTADPDSAGDVPRGDFEEMLRAIANMFMFVEGKHRAAEDPSGRKQENRFKALELVFNEYADIVSEKEIQLLCEKYGIDWEEDIISEELKEGDYGSRAGV